MNIIRKFVPLFLSFFFLIIPTFAQEIHKITQKASTQNSEQEIIVRHFSRYRKVIPLYYQNGKLQISSIKLPDIVITNNSDNVQKLERIEVIGKHNSDELTRYKLEGDEGNELSSRINHQIKILTEADEMVRLKDLFGEMYPPKNGFSNTNEIQPSDSYLAPLSRLLFVHYVGNNKIDDMLLVLTFKNNSVEKQIKFPVVLTHYQTKGKYICPVRGSINIVNLPTNFAQHRSSTYQEFAVDIWDVRLDENIREYTTSRPNPTRLSDYYIYHRDVLAVADGEIIEVGDKFPEELMNNPANFTTEYFQQLRKELTPKIGFDNFVRGNYIIIDHKNGEYSFYGHLSEGTIRVKVGKMVKQGEVIARVGNTGHSDAPHLHFHLMDSPNCYEANGLPLVFEDIPNTTLGFDISETNSLINTDFLYLFIPNLDKPKPKKP